VMHSGPRIEG